LSGILSSIEHWATNIVDSLGYAGIAMLVALETIIPPIPSEVILPLAGSLVAEGRFSFPLVLVAATLGSLAGSLALYGAAYWFGPLRLHRLVERYGRYVLVGIDDLDRAQRAFDRYGGPAVIVGRLVPGVRSLISLPAGLVRMSLGRFLLYTAIGSAIWNSVLIIIGWVLKDQWHRVSDYMPLLEYAVVAVGLALIAWFVMSRVRSRRIATLDAGSQD
jgi:membrane protein DedA with SNARE-associated domain